MPEKILEKFQTEVELSPREILARLHRMAEKHNYTIQQKQLRFEAFSGQISFRYAKSKDDFCAKFIIREVEEGLSEIKGEVILKTDNFLYMLLFVLPALPCFCCLPFLMMDFNRIHESLAVLPEVYFASLGIPCLTLLVASGLGLFLVSTFQKRMIANIFEAIDEMPKAKYEEKKKRG
jgi:hypothetical protein